MNVSILRLTERALAWMIPLQRQSVVSWRQSCRSLIQLPDLTIAPGGHAEGRGYRLPAQAKLPETIF